jgi:hypothetical protein
VVDGSWNAKAWDSSAYLLQWGMCGKVGLQAQYQL